MLAQRVTELLAPGGRLADRWPRYEDRAAQRSLADDVARTIQMGGVLLAEAPTGVGKSLGYLLPAVLAAAERDQRVIVATCTKSLQDQLFERDLPTLLEALDVAIPCARLKGKQNYLCARALETAEAEGAEEQDALDLLRAWAQVDEVGDLDRFRGDDAEAARRLRPRVAADPVACSGLACRRGRECFWVRARRRAAEAKLLVVNHALLALSGEAEGLLPECDVLIVDEAHRLEGVLLAQLERAVSRHRFDEALRLVGSGRLRRAGADAKRRAEATPGGLAARLRGLLLPLFDTRGRDDLLAEVERLVARVAGARADVDRLFVAIEPEGARRRRGGADGPPTYPARDRYRSASELLGRELEPLETTLGHCASFARAFQSLAARVGGLAAPGAPGEEVSAPLEELAAELDHAAAVWGALGSDLEDLGTAAERDRVYWRTASARGVELHGAPVSAGDHARRLVLGRAPAVILTSATLSAGGDFAFLADRLGLGEERGMPYEAVSYPSPFPLERQMRVFVCAPRPDEASGIAAIVAALAEATGRNQLVLLTAHERLRRVREHLLGRLPTTRLLAQEWDGSAARVTERFRDGGGAVLLGVQSLWEGVDFPGEALEILVVAKLPFSVPDDPLVEARAERLRDRGLEPFRHDAVPEAVLRFRQGVGRLIRRSDDRGILVVCDPRLANASYRHPFLESLPVAPRLVADPEALAAEAAAFFAAAPPAPEAVGVGMADAQTVDAQAASLQTVEEDT